MLIYHKNNDQLFVTRIARTVSEDIYTTLPMKRSSLPNHLKEAVDQLTLGSCYITGDTSLRGKNGNFFIERSKLSEPEYAAITKGEERYAQNSL